MKVKALSRVQLFATPWTAAYSAVIFLFKQQHVHHVICLETRVVREQIVLNAPASAKVALHIANRTLLKLRQIDHLYVKLCIRSA